MNTFKSLVLGSSLLLGLSGLALAHNHGEEKAGDHGQCQEKACACTEHETPAFGATHASHDHTKHEATDKKECGDSCDCSCDCASGECSKAKHAEHHPL